MGRGSTDSGGRPGQTKSRCLTRLVTLSEILQCLGAGKDSGAGKTCKPCLLAVRKGMGRLSKAVCIC